MSHRKRIKSRSGKKNKCKKVKKIKSIKPKVEGDAFIPHKASLVVSPKDKEKEINVMSIVIAMVRSINTTEVHLLISTSGKAFSNLHINFSFTKTVDIKTCGIQSAFIEIEKLINKCLETINTIYQTTFLRLALLSLNHSPRVRKVSSIHHSERNKEKAINGTISHFDLDRHSDLDKILIEDKKTLIQMLIEKTEDGADVINLKDKLERNSKKDHVSTRKEGELRDVIKYHVHSNIRTTFIYNVDSIPVHPSSVSGIPWSRLNEERLRILTFLNYPSNAAKSAILLAADGFVYLGSGKDVDDSVMCHFCYKVKNRWLPLDDIPEVHQQLSPDCSMVTQINCSNISLNTNLDRSLFDQLLNPKQSRNRADDTRYNEIETGEAVENYKNPGDNIEPDGTSLPRERYNNNYTQITSSSEQSTPTRETSADAASQSETSEASPIVETTTTSLANSNFTSSNSSPSNHITSATASNTSTTVSTSQTSIAASPISPATSTSDPPEVVTQTVSATRQNSAKGNAGGPTYSELGIVTERPKRFEYAVLAKRMETFLSWPRNHRLRPKELAEAGFYYAGYGDCARCFYCGGGLRNWEDEDDVWVEHARWFPKCAYIRQQMGQVFVDTIQEMNKSFDHISMKMVMEKIGDAASAFQLDSKDNPLKRDPAVKTIVDMGYPLAEVIATAGTIKEDGNIVSADKIYEKVVEHKVKKNPSKMFTPTSDATSVESVTTIKANLEKLRTLKEQNNQLRQQTVCKICMDKEVAVVFLPCGHFVSCTDCASAMKDCPVCRNHVKGIVRAFMG